ncbi:MAG: RNA polymerase sigma factor [Kiritimatiellia bacterium]
MTTDAEIIAITLRDRERGAKLLVEKYRERLGTVARDLGVDTHTEEDLVFRTFERAIEKIDTCHSADSFFSWLCVILRNFHRQTIRTQAFKRMVITDEPPDVAGVRDTSSEAARAIDSARLHALIEALPKEMREVILMRYFMEVPVARMAKILAIPEGTVKSRLYHARVYLGGLIEKPRVRRVLRGLALLLLATVAIVALRLMPGGRAVKSDVWLGDKLEKVCPGRRLGEVEALDIEIYVGAPHPSARRMRLDVVNDGAVALAPCSFEMPEGTYTVQLLLVQIGNDIWGRVASSCMGDRVVPVAAARSDGTHTLAVRLTGLNRMANPPAWRMKAAFAAVCISGGDL